MPHTQPRRRALGPILLLGLLLGLPLALLGACGEPEPALTLPDARGDLRPVLARDGRPSVAGALAQTVRDDVPLLAPAGPRRVRVVGGELLPLSELEGEAAAIARQRGLRGARLLPAPDPTEPARVVVEGLAWDALHVDAVVVRASVPERVAARVRFRTSAMGDPGRPLEPGDFPAENALRESLEPGPEQRDWAFAVDDHAAWQGTVTALLLELCERPADSAVVDRVLAIGRDLSPGSSPRTAGETFLDAGLVTLARPASGGEAAREEARRAYPALEGLDQVLVLEDPSVETFTVSYALPPSVRRVEGAVTFQVLVAEGGARATTPSELARLRERATPVHAHTLDPLTERRRWHTAHFAFPVAALGPAPGGGPRTVFLAASGGVPRGRVCGLWAAPVASGREARGRPSVLLVTLDTLRADHVGSYGGEVATPVLDGLAARGARFADAYSTSNITGPSHATMLTGLFPKEHRVEGNAHRLPPAVPTLAELFRAQGYATLASSAVWFLDAAESGLGDGFDVYCGVPEGDFMRSAPDVNAQLGQALDALGDAPFFAWVHYYDAHGPYEPDPEFVARHWQGPDEGPTTLLERFARLRAEGDPAFATVATPAGGRRARTGEELSEAYLADVPHAKWLRGMRDPELPRALYRAGVEQLDRDVGRLFELLDARGRLERTTVCVTSDHGEGLGEHDVWFDHSGVFHCTLHVPLIVAGFGVDDVAGGRVVEPAVQLVDLFPTLCELAGVPASVDVRGRSLVPALRGEPLQGLARRWFEHGNGAEVGFRTRDEHFLLHLEEHTRGVRSELLRPGAVELFDLPAPHALEVPVDPGAPGAAARAERGAAEARAWLEARLLEVDSQWLGVDDPATIEALRALGYTAD